MRISICVFLAALCCAAAPKITAKSARNGASYATLVAPGGRFALVGTEVGPADAVLNETYPLQTTLGGVSVTVTIGDATVNAWVLQASAGKVVAMLPSNTPTGKGSVMLMTEGGMDQTPIEVASRAVGLYGNGSFGAGTAVAFTADAGTPVALNAVARPGQQVRLRATGLGAITDGDEANGPTPQSFDGDFEVRVGNAIATLVSAKRTEVAGTDELTIEVPAGALEGCFVPVAVKSAGGWSNFVSLPIAANGTTCSSNQFGSSDLDRIFSSGGDANIGGVSLLRLAVAAEQGEFVTDSVGGAFLRVKADYIGSTAGIAMDIPNGSCYILNMNGDLQSDPSLPQAQPLAAGNMTLTGPKGMKSLGNVKGAFSVELGKGISIALPPGVPSIPGFPSDLYLEPGAYTLASQGGDDVGPFTVQTPFNPAQWTNGSSITTVLRSNDLLLTWTGGGANDLVVATGVSSSDSLQTMSTFYCVAKASARQITVPAFILQNLPASEGEGSILGLISFSEPKAFTARGLDSGSITTNRLSARQVKYQ